MSISLRALCGVVAITVTIAAAAPAVAQPVQDQQCHDPEWVKLHPLICTPFGFGGATRGGGGGLLGGIPIVGGILKGLGL